MERLYNPDLMSEAEIKQTFVARQPQIEELVALIEKQPQGAGVQHAVVVAPRGMGKTTMLLMVQFALKDRGLDAQWQAVRFPEESYAINDLADFWLETLRNLAVAVETPDLAIEAENLIAKFPRNADLQEAALALIKDWCRRENKRLLLLVDNFDQILEQINSERDNAALRNALMNDGTLQIIGGATAFFHEARSYDQPLYNFFRLYHLEELTFEEIQNLLRQRAAADGTPNFEAILQANTVRLRVLRYFTGGNPRLVLMLYRVVMDSQVVEVREALEKLLDEVTPYYKAKIDSLPPQQRKILDHIARISSQTNEGLTPGEIAKATRLSPQATSTQLRRLGELGYVRAANLRVRNSYYTLSEPLYAIWHQMRFGRGPRRRVQWLVDFIKSWYDADELKGESQRLEDRFRNFFQTGATKEALSSLQHRLYLAHAMSDVPVKSDTLESVIDGYLQLGAIKELLDVLPEMEMKKFSDATLSALFDAGCVTKEVMQRMKISSAEMKIRVESAKANGLIGLAIQKIKDEMFEDALQLLSPINSWDLHPVVLQTTHFVRSVALLESGFYKEATVEAKMAMEVETELTDHSPMLNVLLGSYLQMEEFEQAMSILDQFPDHDQEHLHFLKGLCLLGLDRHQESVLSFDKEIIVSSEDPFAWFYRGLALKEQGLIKESIMSWQKAFELETPEIKLEEKWRFGLHQGNFILSVFNGDCNSARTEWMRCFRLSREQNLIDEWKEMASQTLSCMIEAGNARFIRDLIRDTQDEESLFPLARALDYLFTGDEALIEKLSPEIRNLVVEMVEKLRPAVGDAAAQPAPKARPRPAPRQRIHKQLR